MLLVYIEHAGLDTLICFTKQDLIADGADDEPSGLKYETEKFYETYLLRELFVFNKSALIAMIQSCHLITPHTDRMPQ